MESNNYGRELTTCAMSEIGTRRNPYSNLFMVSV
jgi:hypothetical protein